jgi:hypothetical protein
MAPPVPVLRRRLEQRRLIVFLAALDGGDKLGRALVEHLTGALDAALADIEHLGGFGLGGQVANWRLARPIATVRQIRQLRRYNRARGACRKTAARPRAREKTAAFLLRAASDEIGPPVISPPRARAMARRSEGYGVIKVALPLFRLRCVLMSLPRLFARTPRIHHAVDHDLDREARLLTFGLVNLGRDLAGDRYGLAGLNLLDLGDRAFAEDEGGPETGFVALSLANRREQVGCSLGGLLTLRRLCERAADDGARAH